MIDKIKLLKSILKSDGPHIIALLKSFYYMCLGKRIAAHARVNIKHLYNITTHGNLYIGTDANGFMSRHDRTYLNIRGKLIINSDFSIYKGCRLDIGPEAVCELNSGYINANTKLVIMHGLKIGSGCAIAWDCEFLDEDFHKISGANKTELQDKTIEIGSHVWIGSGVKILKGVKIGDNNIIAANSVVTKSFMENNILIGGNPARIIKRDINWE